jgi:hypothetical protein
MAVVYQFPPRPGPSCGDPMLESMKAHGLPITRKMYMALNYPNDEMPDPYPAELEALLPDEIRRLKD